MMKSVSMNRGKTAGIAGSILLASLSAGIFAQTQTMRIGGVARTYIVHAPSGPANPPLVFNIHGYNMDAASEQSYTKMDQIANEAAVQGQFIFKDKPSGMYTVMVNGNDGHGVLRMVIP